MRIRLRFWIIGVLTLFAIVATWIMDPIPQNPAYHLFADTRYNFGIPNFYNVITNMPFVIIGIIGIIRVSRSNANNPFNLIYSILFVGILLTGIGSSYYHLSPDNRSLVFDRMPMTIVFMSFLSAIISEYINRRVGLWLLFPLITTGIVGVLYWYYTEMFGTSDLRFYALIQFYPVVMIPIILFLFKKPDLNEQLIIFLAIVVWYIVAKLFEHFDYIIFQFTGFISGHSLKHLVAAISTSYILKAFLLKYNRKSFHNCVKNV